MSELSPEQQELLALLEEANVLSLATEDEANQPVASLTPYLYHQGLIWVFVSSLSRHTAHLIAEKPVGLLIHEIEKPKANPFVLKRASLQCKVAVHTEDREAILDAMAEKLGDTVGLLRQLGDFQLFKLNPFAGQYIAGFGKAYTLNTEDLSLSHINPAKKTT